MRRKLPATPNSGRVIPRSWHLDLWNYVKDIKYRGDGKTVKVNADGVISAIPQFVRNKAPVVDVEAIEEQISDRGINKTFAVQSDSASYDEVLDDTIDYRRRHIECWIDQTSAGDNTSPTVGEEWLNCPASDVDIVSDSPYTVYVDSSDGSLNVRATASATVQAVIWVRASNNVLAPCSCPCTTWLPTEWPCNDLVEEYTFTNNLISPIDGATIGARKFLISDPTTWREERMIQVETSTAYPFTSCRWESGNVATERRDNTNTNWQATTENCIIDLINGRWRIGFSYVGFKDSGDTPVGDYQTTLDNAGWTETVGILVAEAT